jgi:predicted GIY-YIG superfamily endonuclease
MTFNRKGIFSQSQLAVLLEMPSAEAIANGQDVRIMVAPEGCKNVPTDVPARLTEFGWTATTVGMAPEHVHTMWGGVKTKRRQYGIRHRIASTIHAVMGSDVGKLATSVSTSDPKYRLWENEQVVVLLSRTSRAPDLIFVGDPEETVRALIGLIQIRSQYSEYMQHVLTVMSGSLARDFPPAAPVVELAHHPFRPIDVPLPEDNSGFCYILVSLQDSETTYIGQTRRLIARLQAHNSGNGASTTSDARLRPWALLAFVCGFDGDRPAMRRFERDWQRKRDRGRYTDGPLSPLQTADLARTVIGDWNEIPGNGPDLRFVRTGTMGITLD